MRHYQSKLEKEQLERSGEDGEPSSALSGTFSLNLDVYKGQTENLEMETHVAERDNKCPEVRAVWYTGEPERE